MIRVIGAVAAFGLFACRLFAMEFSEAIKPSEVLDVGRCIEIALKHHPDIKASLYNTKIYESRVGQAKGSYYPQVNFSTGYSNTKAQSMPDVTGKSFNDYIGTTSLKQTIYDFGRTSGQVDVQKKNVESSGFDSENTVVQVVFNVKEAYYNFLRSKKSRDVALEVVKQYEIHLNQAKALCEVGTKPRIDVTKGEVDLSNARLNLIKAENSLKLAKVTLDNAMGMPQAPEYDIKDTLSYEKVGMTFDEALAKAYENRADLKSLKAKVEAAKSSVALSKKDFYPALSAKLTYSVPRNSNPSGDDWDVGLTLSVPIFSGFTTVYKVEESKANWEMLKLNEESLLQKIYLEVKEAYLNLMEAEERIKASELASKQAKENLDLARGRYGVGLGSSIEITDSVVTYARSSVEYIQALYDYKMAEASLIKAMGMK